MFSLDEIFQVLFIPSGNLPSCTAALAVLAELAAWEETLLSYWGSVSQQPMLGMRKFGLKASWLLTFFFQIDFGFWINILQKIRKKWTKKRRQLASESMFMFFFPGKYEIIVKSPCISRAASLQASMDRREADSTSVGSEVLKSRQITSATIPLQKKTTNKKVLHQDTTSRWWFLTFIFFKIFTPGGIFQRTKSTCRRNSAQESSRRVCSLPLAVWSIRPLGWKVHDLPVCLCSFVCLVKFIKGGEKISRPVMD